LPFNEGKLAKNVM